MVAQRSILIGSMDSQSQYSPSIMQIFFTCLKLPSTKTSLYLFSTPLTYLANQRGFIDIEPTAFLLLLCRSLECRYVVSFIIFRSFQCRKVIFMRQAQICCSFTRLSTGLEMWSTSLAPHNWSNNLITSSNELFYSKSSWFFDLVWLLLPLIGNLDIKNNIVFFCLNTRQIDLLEGHHSSSSSASPPSSPSPPSSSSSSSSSSLGSLRGAFSHSSMFQQSGATMMSTSFASFFFLSQGCTRGVTQVWTWLAGSNSRGYWESSGSRRSLHQWDLIPLVEPRCVNSPQLVSLVQEEVVSVALSEEVRQESQDEVLPEESMGLEAAEFLEDRKDDVLPGHVIDREAGQQMNYMLTPLKIKALSLFSFHFS